MRWRIGQIPNNPGFTPDDSWRSLREPSPWLLQLIAFPIGVACAFIVGWLWFCLTPARGEAFAVSAGSFLLVFASVIIVHELIHAAVHPKAGTTPQSILGFWPSRMLFYAHYDGQLSRNRFLLILAMPFVVISLVPLLLAALVKVAPNWLVFASTINALLSCGDVVGIGLIFTQVPATAIVQNQGWRTYWKKPAQINL
jgi:Putative zincin peptidase